jgi:hypothetical protein
MSSPSRRGMDEVWTSGRGMPMSRTKIGERSSVAPGDYASIRALISIPRPDGVGKVQICPMSRSFLVNQAARGYKEMGLRGGQVTLKREPIYPQSGNSGWSEGPPKNSQSVFIASFRGRSHVLKKGRGQRSPLFYCDNRCPCSVFDTLSRQSFCRNF